MRCSGPLVDLGLLDGQVLLGVLPLKVLPGSMVGENGRLWTPVCGSLLPLDDVVT